MNKRSGILVDPPALVGLAMRPRRELRLASSRWLAWLCLAWCCAASGGARGDELGSADWSVPPAEAVRGELVAWLEQRQTPEAQRTAALQAWDSGHSEDRLLAFMQALAAADDRLLPFVQLGGIPWQPRLLTDNAPILDLPAAAQDCLRPEVQPPLVRQNLRLFWGRVLTQRRQYEQALPLLDGLIPADVIDPAGLLFYQGINYQRLLKQELGMQCLRRLLQRQAELPKRYQLLADLMHADLARLEVDSLDHISRRMDDVSRRLEQGKSGSETQQLEKGVVESLDKLIERLEKERKQREQQQSSSPQGSNNIKSSRPAQDSMPMQGKGPGDVTRKELLPGQDWGNLAPRERQELLQQVTREFPAHYRDAIEQYFRRLANEEGEQGGQP